MKSNLRNEIKSYIVRQGLTMQEVVICCMTSMAGLTAYPTCPTSSSGNPYTEAVQLADALGYEIVWQRRK